VGLIGCLVVAGQLLVAVGVWFAAGRTSQGSVNTPHLCADTLTASQDCSGDHSCYYLHTFNPPPQSKQTNQQSTGRSGVTAFLDDKVGYPIPIESLVPAVGDWSFRGLSWAQPSVPQLRQLLRRVYSNREEAAAKGAAARARMVERFSPPAIARLLVEEFKRIEALLPQI